MALMVDRQNNYLGGAFITNRKIKERLLARVRTKAGPIPKGMKCQTRLHNGFSPASWQR